MGELDAGWSLSRLPDQFGKYSLLGHLATGGMAEVYLARQTGIQGFEKVVVIKCVRSELEMNAEATGFFLDEARLVATLEHPNIAQVYEIGLVNNSYFFVMEYVQGADLRQLMDAMVKRKQPVPLGDAIYIASHVCAALHYAHEKCGFDGAPLNIIHRDVSPSNVLLSHDGAVKLCDFGIAKAQNRSSETQGGVLKGKYSYMSPEQCRSMPLDRRSDIYAMGVLLYELTTLKRVYSAPSDFELLRAIVEEPVRPPSTRTHDYPPELERIVLRALEKDPEQRYQTAQDMQLDLEAFARENKLPQSSVHVAKLMGGLFERRTSGSIAIPRVVGEGTGDMTTEIEITGNEVHRTPNRLSTPLPIMARGSHTTPVAVPIVDPQPAPAPPAPALPVAPARKGPSAFWLVGAVVFALAGGAATYLLTTQADEKPNDEHKAAISADVDKLASAFDQAVRSAHLKADGIAATPILRAAIETDAVTMQDVVTNEYIFTPGKGEVIEIFQRRGKDLVSLVRLPPKAPALKPLKGGETRVEVGDQGPIVIAGAPIANNKAGVAGVLEVAMPVDMSSPRRGLDEHATAAWVDGFGKPIPLVGTPTTDPPISVALPTSNDWNNGSVPANLRAVPVAVPAREPPAWLAPVRIGGFGAAGLLLLIYVFGWMIRKR